tara:strand:- start:395 stop:640 length:246 start_codon:yes stop_codon:yes gene_type:complete
MAKRRTKKEIEVENRLIFVDVTDTLSYLTYTNEKDIKAQVNEYRNNHTELDNVSISQVRKVLKEMIQDGLVKKRKDDYKYV